MNMHSKTLSCPRAKRSLLGESATTMFATGLAFLLAIVAVVATLRYCSPWHQPPSAYYVGDEIQYFPPGPEFNLVQEAAALEAAAGKTVSE
ncbi:hypothetical protein NG895_11285 [Aeoliella sp. ICT_H6.2]|uniref:Uncharacterized protein n=1 Tax=Aeoliella straminimaris TaxID=2954799 RepID=A0A9X2JHC3_9BACT|nr:hypothetical protein [Aeoliella straminimaris]MCO6044488.1 hypothetical protein [Aeoliella straminimaris]